MVGHGVRALPWVSRFAETVLLVYGTGLVIVCSLLLWYVVLFGAFVFLVGGVSRFSHDLCYETGTTRRESNSRRPVGSIMAIHCNVKCLRRLEKKLSGRFVFRHERGDSGCVVSVFRDTHAGRVWWTLAYLSSVRLRCVFPVLQDRTF